MKLVIEPSSALSLAVMLEPTAPAAAQAQPLAEPWIDLVKEIVAARAAREPAQASEAGEAGELVVRVLVVITGGNVEWGKVAKWFAEAEADEEAEQEKPAP
jgi:threonine dehydratase